MPPSTRQILFGLWLLTGVVSSPVQAQQWTGTAALGLTGGHQTNAYLDPVLGSWDPLTDRNFAALAPRVGLVRNARRTRLDVTARSRLYPRRPNAPQFTQGSARVRYRLSPSWTVGATGGGTRYRFRSSRDSWWALSSVEWAPTTRSALTLRGGVTERYVTTAQGTDRQPSALVALNGSTWLTDRLHAEGFLYWNSGRTSTADVRFGGTGATVRGTYWPTGRWSIEAEVAFEQLRYEVPSSSSTARDRIGRGGITTRWEVHPSITLFAQAQALKARLAQTDPIETDVHVSAGIRLQVQRVLGGTSVPPPRRRVCRSTEDGIRIQIPYDGDGTPHLTGDFNDWTLPGLPMTPTDGDTWTATLSPAPGQYAYRIRVVDGAERRWLDLPSYAQTADDAFGGTNGVCTVQ